MTKGIWERGYSSSESNIGEYLQIKILSSLDDAMDSLIEENVIEALKDYSNKSYTFVPNSPGPIVVSGPWDGDDFDIKIDIEAVFINKMDNFFLEDANEWAKYFENLAKLIRNTE